MPEDSNERLTQLELALTHHQRDYEVLNRVVVEQAKQMELMQRQVTHLESLLRSVAERLPAGQSDSFDEKPPHY